MARAGHRRDDRLPLVKRLDWLTPFGIVAVLTLIAWVTR